MFFLVAKNVDDPRASVSCYNDICVLYNSVETQVIIILQLRNVGLQYITLKVLFLITVVADMNTNISNRTSV